MVRSPGLAAAAHSGFADVVASLAAFAAVGETGDLVEVQAVMATDRPPIAMAERSFVMDVSLHSPGSDRLDHGRPERARRGALETEHLFYLHDKNFAYK